MPSVARDRRRAIREGVGIKIYLLPDEAADLAYLLADLNAALTAPLERVAKKSALAVERIEEKAV